MTKGSPGSGTRLSPCTATGTAWTWGWAVQAAGATTLLLQQFACPDAPAVPTTAVMALPLVCTPAPTALPAPGWNSALFSHCVFCLPSLTSAFLLSGFEIDFMGEEAEQRNIFLSRNWCWTFSSLLHFSFSFCRVLWTTFISAYTWQIWETDSVWIAPAWSKFLFVNFDIIGFKKLEWLGECCLAVTGLVTESAIKSWTEADVRLRARGQLGDCPAWYFFSTRHRETDNTNLERATRKERNTANAWIGSAFCTGSVQNALYWSSLAVLHQVPYKTPYLSRVVNLQYCLIHWYFCPLRTS